TVFFSDRCWSTLCLLYMYIYFVYCFFFFSSRRRHTRCYRDWSSDVCSSDLRLAKLEISLSRDVPCTSNPRLSSNSARYAPSCPRSEERRVGKECRSRWWT